MFIIIFVKLFKSFNTVSYLWPPSKKTKSNLSNKISLDKFDFVFLDGGHKYETVLNDLKSLTKVVVNKGVVLCDDYDLTYAPGVKKAIDEYVLLNNFNLRILSSRFAEITKKFN